MRVYASQQFSRSHELSSAYIVSIGISDGDNISANFTINESAVGLFLEKMRALNPEIELYRIQRMVQDGQNVAKYNWRTDNRNLISTINELKESSLISVEFADEICRELPNLISRARLTQQRPIPYLANQVELGPRAVTQDEVDADSNEIALRIVGGNRRRLAFSDHYQVIPTIPRIRIAEGEVLPPEHYTRHNRRPLQFFPHHQAMPSVMWQHYDPAQYGPDVPRSDDRNPPKPGIHSEKIDELISKKIISESDIPDPIRCLIGSHIMTDPVHFSCFLENNYDRPMIEHWLYSHSTDPMTRKHVAVSDLVSATELKEKIQFFVAQAVLKANNQDNKFDEAKAQCITVSTVQADVGAPSSPQPRR